MAKNTDTPDMKPDIPVDIEAIIAKRVAEAFAEKERALAEEAEKAAAAALAEKVKKNTGPDPYAMVTIKLGFDKQNIGPLFVRLNDYEQYIRRGVLVEVPYYVAKHIEECEAQDKDRIMMIHGLSEQFERRAAALGVPV